jgi:hypothetical protein
MVAHSLLAEKFGAPRSAVRGRCAAAVRDASAGRGAPDRPATAQARSGTIAQDDQGSIAGGCRSLREGAPLTYERLERTTAAAVQARLPQGP